MNPLLPDDKRERERVPVPAPIQGEVTVFLPMTIRDISERGARIETSFALQLDSLHDFRLSLDSRTVVVKGRVLHCQIASIGDGSILYRSGLEFVEPSPHVREAITAFVEAHRAALAAAPPIIDAEPVDDEE